MWISPTFRLLATMVVCTLWMGTLVADTLAQAGRQVVVNRDWAVYVGEQGGGKVCYVISEPKDMEPKNVNRGDVLFYITFRPTENVQNEVSIVIGYPFRDGSQATIQVGGQQFQLFTRENGAFVESAATEQQIVAAMRAGSTMTVTGVSARGTTTIDQDSLLGVTASLNRARQECS